MNATDYQIELLREEVRRYTGVLLTIALHNALGIGTPTKDIAAKVSELMEECRTAARRSVDAKGW